jgi:hypothetical protein
MASPLIEPQTIQSERGELEAVLRSHLFARSPTLAHLLTYLCEKKFAGESGQIKEYSVALDVFGRGETFDQDTDSIVRVQANRLRKRLAEYYATDGAHNALHITIPIGQYVPVFERLGLPRSEIVPAATGEAPSGRTKWTWIGIGGIALVLVAAIAYFALRTSRDVGSTTIHAPSPPEQMVGLPVGDEVRILAGSTKSYVDRAGHLWAPDAYFTGGTPVRTPIHNIWRTQDPTIFRNSRAGEFKYDIPLKAGVYELHLYFAENFYGPDNDGGGGEGSRMMSVTANGKPLLTDFDVTADAGSGRTADLKVFTDIEPAADGHLHLSFSSVKGGSILSAIEIVPGKRHQARPVRIIARDVPYYSNDSRLWSPDTFFKGGQISASEVPADDTEDPELYETSRWGHFSYSIPVTPGEYTVVMYFIAPTDRHLSGGKDPDAKTEAHTFNVFCNGRTILSELDVVKEAGYNRPLIKKVSSLEPNAQGKLLLEFVPITDYATVTAIEVIPH